MAIELNLQVDQTNNEFRAATPGSIFVRNPASLYAGWHSGALVSYGVGARFRGVTIPKGSIIEEAYITLTCKATNEAAVKTRVSAELEDNPGDFSADNYASAMVRWANRTAQVDWDDGGWSPIDSEHNSPDIKAPIQTIVNRPGWVSGNHVVIFWEDWQNRSTHLLTAMHNAWPFAQAPLKTIKLYVRYEPILAPTVATDPATDIAANSSTLNGTLDADGGGACDCGFEWGETAAYGNTTPTQSRTTGQTFSQAISGLDPNKTYHFRAFATNAGATSYGADRTFTTLVALPAVTTDPATALSALAATLNGTLDDDGGEACECGFEWGLDTGYGTTTPTESKTTGEALSQVIGGLFPTTTYHFRAFAINSVGRSNGADRSFASAQVITMAHALARREL